TRCGSSFAEGMTAPSAPTSLKTFPVTWDELHRHARALAWRVAERGPWRGLVAVTRGGLVPAAIVARELDIRLIDTVCVASYEERQRGEVVVLKAIAGDGAGWLMIDDLVDTGHTARVVREMLPKAHFATIYAKPAGRLLVDTFITEVSQDTWIVFPWDSEGEPPPAAAPAGKPARGAATRHDRDRQSLGERGRAPNPAPGRQRDRCGDRRADGAEPRRARILGHRRRRGHGAVVGERPPRHQLRWARDRARGGKARPLPRCAGQAAHLFRRAGRRPLGRRARPVAHARSGASPLRQAALGLALRSGDQARRERLSDVAKTP